MEGRTAVTAKLLVAIALLLMWVWIGGIVYLETGFGKRLYHDLMGWHQPDNSGSFDGCSEHSRCKYCGKEIMQDSQGNWF